MKKVNLAYIAGIIDGEGSIHITKLPPNKIYKNVRYILHFYVGNTNLNMLKELKLYLGGSLTLDSRKDKPNNKPFWHWNLGPKASYSAIKQLLLYLRIKKERAKLAIEFYELCKNQKRKIIRKKDGTASGTLSLTNKEIEEREDFYQKIKILNVRGIK
jgi:hypothetical protein